MISARAASQIWAVAGALAAAPVLASAPEPISVICTADGRASEAKVDRHLVAELCDAAQVALRALPHSADSAPALRLLVTAANDRGVGLTGTWVFADGREVAALPVTTSFFDKNGTPALRAKAIAQFFKVNPIPTAP
ncbi:MAG: hypothetical protein U5N55_12500 [Cypionkella sp.]|nr:hypothetical protein [Cypionkella sp.]